MGCRLPSFRCPRSRKVNRFGFPTGLGRIFQKPRILLGFGKAHTFAYVFFLSDKMRSGKPERVTAFGWVSKICPLFPRSGTLIQLYRLCLYQENRCHAVELNLPERQGFLWPAISDPVSCHRVECNSDRNDSKPPLADALELNGSHKNSRHLFRPEAVSSRVELG